MPINYKDYPPDWDQTRARILQRANNCCEKCGLPNYQIIDKKTREMPTLAQFAEYDQYILNQYKPAQAMQKVGFTKIVLTIAHLDHDKDNHQVKDERLAAWCQKCHLGYDLTRHVANRKYGRNHEKNNLKLF